MRVTPNAQFLFGAVSRPQYVLKATEQLVATCKLLKARPLDPFLQQWRAACLEDPALPSVADFLQVSLMWIAVWGGVKRVHSQCGGLCMLGACLTLPPALLAHSSRSLCVCDCVCVCMCMYACVYGCAPQRASVIVLVS